MNVCKFGGQTHVEGQLNGLDWQYICVRMFMILIYRPEVMTAQLCNLIGGANLSV